MPAVAAPRASGLFGGTPHTLKVPPEHADMFGVIQRTVANVTPAREAGARRWVSHARVLAFSAALAAAAVALYTHGGLATQQAALHAGWPFWAVVALFIAAERLVVEFPVRRQAWTISMDEVALAIGLLIAPPSQLLPATVLAAAVVNIGMHRRPPQKVAYNLSATAVRVAGAAVIYFGLLGSSPPLQSAGYVAAFCAILVPSALSLLTVPAVVALAGGGRPSWSLWAPITTFVVSVINTSFALITLEVWQANARGLWLLGLVYGMLYAAYRTLVSARRQQAGLGHVDAFTRAVSAESSSKHVSAALLRTAGEMSGAHVAELVLCQGEQSLTRWFLTDDGVCLSEEVSDPTVVAAFNHVSSCSSRLVFAGRRISGSGRRERQRSLLLPAGSEAGIVVGFTGQGGLRGAVVVAGHLGAYRSFSRRDALLMETLTSHAVAALQNARLAERVHREVSEREHDALHDQLTGLPNRLLFLDRLERAAATATADRMTAVLLVDLDRFHDINATFGHRTGDELLAHVGTRLRDEVPSTSTVARLGADEFAVLLCEVADADHAHQTAAHLLTVLERPHDVGVAPLVVEASVGISFAPTHGSGAVELLRRADVAVYAAKASASGIEAYTPGIDRHSRARLQMVAELRTAIERGELEVHYQPKAELSTGRVSSAEALARWVHPERGFVPPSEFIVVAEHTGLIRPLTRWMLRSVASQLARWRREGLNLEVAVNLSARSLFDTNLPGDIAALLGEFHLPPQALRLEITESSLISDPELAGNILHDLSRLGVGLSVDDFGTGYSSLSHLIRLPVDEIKIDRAFVSGIVDRGQELAVVQATIDMGKRLGKQLTAEGIEDQQTWDVLRELGCDLAQGYFLSKPMPAAAFKRWLIERRAYAADAGVLPV